MENLKRYLAIGAAVIGTMAITPDLILNGNPQAKQKLSGLWGDFLDTAKGNNCFGNLSNWDFDVCLKPFDTWREALFKEVGNEIDDFRAKFDTNLKKAKETGGNTREQTSNRENTTINLFPLEVKGQDDLINIIQIRLDKTGTLSFEADGQTPKLACYHWTGSNSTTTDSLGPVDLYAEEGRKVTSVVNGTISSEPRKDVDGTHSIYIKGDDGLFYFYTHVKNLNSRVIDSGVVKQGDQIAEVGKSGNTNSSGNFYFVPDHLHFQISNSGFAKNDKSTGEFLAGLGLPCPGYENTPFTTAQTQEDPQQPPQEQTPTQSPEQPKNPQISPTESIDEPTSPTRDDQGTQNFSCPASTSKPNPFVWSDKFDGTYHDLDAVGDMYKAFYIIKNEDGTIMDTLDNILTGKSPEMTTENFIKGAKALCDFNQEIASRKKSDFNCKDLSVNPTVCIPQP